jgi:hypothetical protein
MPSAIYAALLGKTLLLSAERARRLLDCTDPAAGSA